jgi:hypothetical protein
MRCSARLRALARAGLFLRAESEAARRIVLALSSASDYPPRMPDDAENLTPADASDGCLGRRWRRVRSLNRPNQSASFGRLRQRASAVGDADH